MSTASAKPSIADSFTRLLRLNLGGGPPQVSCTQLMEASENHLACAARTGTAREQRIAASLLANPKDYRAWEAEHVRLMDVVAGQPSGERQARALLLIAFSLVHRTALFEYFRARPPRAADRRLLIRYFRGNKSYSRAMVAEHGNYRHNFSSLVCIEHIGTTVLVHQAFGEPFRRYEHLYADYYRSYCNSILAPPEVGDDGSDSVRMLLPYIKYKVLDVRARLLAMHSTDEASSRTTR